MKETVVFPEEIFETAETKEELEDWLLVHNQNFIKKLRKSRKDDISGKGKNWEELKEYLCIK